MIIIDSLSALGHAAPYQLSNFSDKTVKREGIYSRLSSFNVRMCAV
jgi:hypothetical protein